MRENNASVTPRNPVTPHFPYLLFIIHQSKAFYCFVYFLTVNSLFFFFFIDAEGNVSVHHQLCTFYSAFFFPCEERCWLFFFFSSCQIASNLQTSILRSCESQIHKIGICLRNCTVYFQDGVFYPGKILFHGCCAPNKLLFVSHPGSD